jgi:hypothetical protein
VTAWELLLTPKSDLDRVARILALENADLQVGEMIVRMICHLFALIIIPTVELCLTVVLPPNARVARL